MSNSYDVITFNLNNFILRRSRVANFADIIKTATIFIKPIFKNSKKVKRIRKYILKMQSISVFLCKTKIADFQRKNEDVSRVQEVFHVIYMFFGSYLGKVCLS